MNLSNEQKALAAIVLISLAVVVGWWFVQASEAMLTPTESRCTVAGKLLPAVNLIPVFLLAGILIGALAFYIISAKREVPDVKAILPLLSEEEKIAFKRLVEKGGEALQSDLTRLEGMTKVKSYRVVKKLLAKGVVEIQNKGKTNIVKLTKPYRRGD